MLETIGISLISTLISFIFETQILKKNTLSIEGAPYWYEKVDSGNKLYVSTYLDKGYEHLDEAKEKVKNKMILIVNDAYEVSLSKEFLHDRSKIELDFINRMHKKSKIKEFLNSKVTYQNIKYDKTLNRIFIRGFITKENLKEYLEQRVIVIKKEIMDYQYDDMMKELENN